MSQSNSYSHLTAKERTALSFPARLINQKGLLKGQVLDFGCGFGTDVKLLAEQGLDIVGYDKYHHPEYPTKRFDTILCFYVLNVLFPEEQSSVLMEVSSLLKPGGIAYFAVRRDIRKDGFRMHKVHHKPTYQCNVKLPFKSIFRNENVEIYAYQHFNLVENPNLVDSSCPFCNPDPDRELIAESATAFAIYDKFPVNEGHSLIIPKRHVSNYFDLTFKEQSACSLLLNYVKNKIQSTFNPDGFNVGINIGESAGQTISHVHLHLIPRYAGDVEEPRGGVRGVIPDKRNY